MGDEIVKVGAKQEEPSAGREYAIGALRGLIGAIPWAGTALLELFFESRGRLKQQRLEKFIGELGQAVQMLGEERVDRAFLQTEEFSDLVEEVVLRVTRSRSEAKRRHLKNVLLKGVQGIQPPDFAVMFLNLLEEITDEELRVYEGFYRAFKWMNEPLEPGANPRDIAPLDYSKPPNGLGEHGYRQIIQSFVRKGLAVDKTALYWGGGTPLTRIAVTELGAAFYEWVVAS